MTRLADILMLVAYVNTILLIYSIISKNNTSKNLEKNEEQTKCEIRYKQYYTTINSAKTYVVVCEVEDILEQFWRECVQRVEKWLELTRVWRLLVGQRKPLLPNRLKTLVLYSKQLQPSWCRHNAVQVTLISSQELKGFSVQPLTIAW